MRQTTGPRKSPGEKIIKDIKRATTARQGIAQQCPERGASTIHPERRSGVRRQGFWHQLRLKLRESLAHLVGFIMRCVVCDASVAFRASFV